MWCNFEQMFKVCVVDPWHFDQISSKWQKIMRLALDILTKFRQNVQILCGWPLTFWSNFIKMFKFSVVDPWHFDQISSKWKKFRGSPKTFRSNFVKMFKFCVVEPWHFDQISSKCQKNVEVGLRKLPKPTHEFWVI